MILHRFFSPATDYHHQPPELAELAHLHHPIPLGNPGHSALVQQHMHTFISDIDTDDNRYVPPIH